MIYLEGNGMEYQAVVESKPQYGVHGLPPLNQMRFKGGAPGYN
jgi:hypothetical protein